jgi:hypothetical protein
MEIASLYGAVHRRTCVEDQSETSGVVQLLWALHAFRAPAHRAACRPIVGSLGLSEIQEATQSPEPWLMEVLDRQPDLLALWEQQRSRFITIGAV